MKKVLAAVLMVASCGLSGCMAVPIATDSAQVVPAKRMISSEFSQPRDGFGKVIIKRDFATSVYPGCKPRVYVDGAAIADVAPGEKIELFLPAGEHVFSAAMSSMFGTPRFYQVAEAKDTVRADRQLVFAIGWNDCLIENFRPTVF